MTPTFFSSPSAGRIPPRVNTAGRRFPGTTPRWRHPPLSEGATPLVNDAMEPVRLSCRSRYLFLLEIYVLRALFWATLSVFALICSLLSWNPGPFLSLFVVCIFEWGNTIHLQDIHKENALILLVSLLLWDCHYYYKDILFIIIIINISFY